MLSGPLPMLCSHAGSWLELGCSLHHHLHLALHHLDSDPPRQRGVCSFRLTFVGDIQGRAPTRLLHRDRMTVGLRAPGPVPRKRDILSHPYQTCCLSLWLFWKHSWGVWFYVGTAAMIDCHHSPPSFSKCPHKSPSFWCTDSSAQMEIRQRVLWVSILENCLLFPVVVVYDASHKQQQHAAAYKEDVGWVGGA